MTLTIREPQLLGGGARLPSKPSSNCGFSLQAAGACLRAAHNRSLSLVQLQGSATNRIKSAGGAGDVKPVESRPFSFMAPLPGSTRTRSASGATNFPVRSALLSSSAAARASARPGKFPDRACYCPQPPVWSPDRTESALPTRNLEPAPNSAHPEPPRVSAASRPPA